ncbi:hypothetical protein DRN86_04390 [Candidatus Geothermarchaeota archaeon]|nr:MAG: hypothetical protein DRN86_04390 [Candidatus Geothermarchaeota archaeon]
MAGSDDHTGRPGLTGPTQRVSCGASFNLKGGLTGVFSDKLTRDSIWKAIWSRHCYATTGDRIILFFNSDEHLMGDEYKTNKPPKLWIKVIGTDGIQEIEIRKGPSVIYNYLVGDIPKNGRGFIKIEWSGVRTKYRNRETIWDGELTVDNGRIINAFPFAFDLPDDGLKEVSSNHLKWKSTSSGDPDGVVLELEFSRDTLIRFRSKQGSFKFKPAEVMNKRKPKIVNFGYLNKRVRIVPLGDSRRIKVVELTYKDEDITPGMNSYWVKVIQWNGEIAWSSPIFINYAES